MILYREKLRSGFASTLLIRVNVKKCYILKYVIEICLFVLFCSDIKRTFRLKNVLLHDHSKR